MNPSAKACQDAIETMKQAGRDAQAAWETLQSFYHRSDGFTGRAMEDLLRTATDEVYESGLPAHVAEGSIMLEPRVYDAALEILREGREIEEAAAQRPPDQPGMLSPAARPAPEPGRVR